MDNEFDFDLELDVDPNSTPEQAFAAPEAQTPAASSPQTPGQMPPPPVQRRRGFPKALIAVSAAAAVCLLAFIGVRAFGGGMQRSSKGLAANETVAFLRDVAQNGSIRAELGLKKLTGYDGTLFVEVKNDLSSAKNARTAVDAALTMKQKTVADISLYADSDKLVLSSDAFLPNQSLGLGLSDLSSKLEKSVFQPDSGTAFALDDDTYEALMNALAQEPGPEMEKLVRQAEKVYESAYKMLRKSVEAHAKKEKSADTLRFGDKDVKVNAITYTANAEAIYGIGLDALQWAKSSKELKELLSMLINDYEDMLEQVDIADQLEDFYENLDEAIETCKDGKEDFLEDNEDLNIQVSLFTAKGKKELLGVKLKYQDGREDVKAEAYWGPTLKDMTDISFKYDDGYKKYSGSYVVKTDDKETFESVLKIKQNSNVLLEGSFQWNKSDGGFTLKLADVTVKGTLEKLSDGFQADLSKITVYGSEQKIDLVLTLRRSVKISDPGAYRNVLDMREDALEDLVYDLEDAIRDIAKDNKELADILNEAYYIFRLYRYF